MKALICGDASWKKMWLVPAILDVERDLRQITHVVVDMQTDVGKSAFAWAMFHGLETSTYSDKWENAGMVIVFHPNVKKSEDILQACQTAWECGVPVNLYRGPGLPTVYWRNPRSPNQRNPFDPCLSPTTA